MYCGQKIQKCADNNVLSICSVRVTHDISIASDSNNIYLPQIIACLFTKPLVSDLFTATAVCSPDPRTLCMIKITLLQLFIHLLIGLCKWYSTIRCIV